MVFRREAFEAHQIADFHRLTNLPLPANVVEMPLLAVLINAIRLLETRG